MPIKKTKLNKKKVTIPKKKKLNKKVFKEKPIVIITQKLPREKCCTDVIKSGEAYSIPFGFMNRLGEIRTPQIGKQSDSRYQKNVSTSTETQPKSEISIQTDFIKEEKPIPLPYYEEEQTKIEEPIQTEGSLRQMPQEKRKYEKKKQGPRRNSIADLEQRYTAITGFIYAGPNLKVKDFQNLVEDLEKKNAGI